MKKILALSASLLFSSAYAVETKVETNNMMQPPKPLQNKIYDAMVGTWQGENDMMGIKMHETIKIHWALNHQYLIMELKASSNQPEISYEGMGVFGVTSTGQGKAQWFDSWGADSAAVGTGTFGDNKFVLADGNERFKETRTFEMKGKQMVMHAKGTMTMPDGKTMDFDETVTYKKVS